MNQLRIWSKPRRVTQFHDRVLGNIFPHTDPHLDWGKTQKLESNLRETDAGYILVCSQLNRKMTESVRKTLMKEYLVTTAEETGYLRQESRCEGPGLI